MNASSTWIARMWRTMLPRRDSVARPSDRFQSGLALLFVFLAMAALPFAASLGSETYAQQKVQSAQQLKDRTQATATLLTDGPPRTAGARSAVGGNAQPTDATWLLADGTRRAGKVDAGKGAVKGSTVSIWVDREGNPVGWPLTQAGAAIDAISVSAGLWAGVLIALALFYHLTAYVLDRFRYARWQHEWFHVLDPSLGSNNSGEGERS